MIKEIDPRDEFVQDVFSFLRTLPYDSTPGQATSALCRAYGFDSHVALAFIEAFREFEFVM